MGQIEHTHSYKCMDASQFFIGDRKVIPVLRHCFWNQHPHLSYQHFVMSNNGTIYHDEYCLSFGWSDEDGATEKQPIFVECRKQSSLDNMQWVYHKSNRQIVHSETGKCLDHIDPNVILSNCDVKSRTQKWFMRSNFDWDPPSHRQDD